MTGFQPLFWKRVRFLPDERVKQAERMAPGDLEVGRDSQVRKQKPLMGGGVGAIWRRHPPWWSQPPQEVHMF